MVFELNKYYKHTSGQLVHILTEIKTQAYGKSLIAEPTDSCDIIPVGDGEGYSVNWIEIKKKEWNEHYGVKEKNITVVSEINYDKINNRFEILDLREE